MDERLKKGFDDSLTKDFERGRVKIARAYNCVILNTMLFSFQETAAILK